MKEVGYLSSADIRKKFLTFFKNKGHKVVESSPLTPFNDNTLLFTNSGMVQFKDVFSGKEKRDYTRAATAQKCIRAGGKHNDLENVGYTARHHTFFEMLGNFSFGDYFKKEAIQFAWEFLIVELQIPASKLWVSVYLDDDEAEKIWTDVIGFPIERISRCGEDNFWQMGDTGPCGPCSEIFFDHGEQIDGGPPGSENEDGDRFIEIWNLVFTQFNRHKDGALEPLPKPSVDTGMGLERISAVMQSVHNNYDTDLFTSIIGFIAQKLNTPINHPSLKVLADHIRSCSFLIAEGVYPGNEGRSYVLRRIIRRAIRHAHKLGSKNLFFYSLVEPLVKTMKDAYPEIDEKKAIIQKYLKTEEEQFRQTLEIGMKLLNLEIAKKPKNISGEVCFNLYDTHGFPLDLTADIAREHNLLVDLDGFNQLMKIQKETSKHNSNQFKNQQGDFVLDLKEKTEFFGYDKTHLKSNLVSIIYENEQVDSIELNDCEQNKLAIVLDKTPFYAESGGQVGDTGIIKKLNDPDFLFEVQDTQKYADAVIHFGVLKSGSLQLGDELFACVDNEIRTETKKNHSATHLLQAALIEVLGSHIEQKGSLVSSDRLRFDFSHNCALTADEILKIESLVNSQILQPKKTTAETMPKDKAIKMGAKAMFGEKYGDEVRVLSIGQKLGSEEPYSLELCGGTHVDNVSEIGLFKIITESSISSGTRRIEGVCGKKAIELMNHYQAIITENAKILQSGMENQNQMILQLQEKVKSLSKENEQLNLQLSKHQVSDLTQKAKKISLKQSAKPVSVLTEIIDFDKKTTLVALDYLKDKLDPAIIILANKTTSENGDNRVNLYCAVSLSLTENYLANELIKKFTTVFSGKGGGRKDMAQAGFIDNENKLSSYFEQFILDLKACK